MNYLASFVLLVTLSMTSQGIERTVSVSGFAEQSVEPDQMNWSLQIVNRGADIVTLAKKQSELTSELTTQLLKTGVLNNQIQTSQISIQEDWQHQNGQRIRQGYIARTGINLNLDDVNLYIRLWEDLATLNSVLINRVGFSYSQRRALEDKLNQQALLNAQDKASQLAQTLGMKLGDVITIAEPGTASVLPVARSQMMAEAGKGSGISPGMIKVQSSIQAVFELRN